MPYSIGHCIFIELFYVFFILGVLGKTASIFFHAVFIQSNTREGH